MKSIQLTRHAQRLACGVLCGALLLPLAGCPTTGPLQAGGSPGAAASGRPLTAAEQRMRQDEERFNKTVIGGMLTGAAIGAGTGLLVGILSGGNSKELRNATVTGAVAGGVLGGIDGYVTAKKEANGRDEVRAMQAAAADVRQDNQKLQAYLDSSNQVLAEGKNRLAALRGDLNAKRISTEQASQLLRQEEQNIGSMRSTLDQAKKTRDQYTQASAQFKGTPQQKRDLDGEISRMGRQVAQLEGNISDYNKALVASRA